MTTAYDELGIDSNADDSAINAAFRRAAKKCHPDLNKGDRNGEQLRRLLAARAAALTSLRQLESMSRDLAVKAKGQERSSLLSVTLAATVALLSLHLISRPPELMRPVSSPQGMLHLDTQIPASRGKSPDGPSFGAADGPAPALEMPPSFDVVYTDEEGKLVAAGRAKAGWLIRLKSGTQTLGETTADERSEWVLTPEAPLPPGNHALSLSEIDPVSQRGISGRESFTLSIAPPRQRVWRKAAK